MEQELFLPTLMHWQYGNNWCGSLKRASFWITPKDEQLTAQLWTGPAIRENAEILYTAQFPISDEGLEQLRQAMKKIGYEVVADRGDHPARRRGNNV